MMFTWLATSICIAGTIVNIWRCNLCFYFWAVGEVMWAVFDVQQGLYSRFALDGLGLALAIVGAIKNPIAKNIK